MLVYIRSGGVSHLLGSPPEWINFDERNLHSHSCRLPLQRLDPTDSDSECHIKWIICSSHHNMRKHVKMPEVRVTPEIYQPQRWKQLLRRFGLLFLHIHLHPERVLAKSRWYQTALFSQSRCFLRLWSFSSCPLLYLSHLSTTLAWNYTAQALIPARIQIWTSTRVRQQFFFPAPCLFQNPPLTFS